MEGHGFIGYIWKNKTKRTKRGIHMDSNLMNDHQGEFKNLIILDVLYPSLLPFRGYLLRQRRMHPAASKVYNNFLAKDFSD